MFLRSFFIEVHFTYFLNNVAENNRSCYIVASIVHYAVLIVKITSELKTFTFLMYFYHNDTFQIVSLKKT